MRTSLTAGPRCSFAAATSILAFILIIAACGSTESPAPVGTLSGTVTIGPLCPVEPCTTTLDPFENLFVVVIGRGEDEIARIPVGTDGTYSGEVPAGAHEATLDPCQWLGCQFEPNRSVTVVANQTVMLDLDIDTGIR